MEDYSIFIKKSKPFLLYTNNSVDKTNFGTNKKWTKEEDKLLLTCVNDFSDRKLRWSDISKLIGTKTKQQCYSRFAQINHKPKT